jgi:hypothetical protein
VGVVAVKLRERILAFSLRPVEWIVVAFVLGTCIGACFGSAAFALGMWLALR